MRVFISVGDRSSANYVRAIFEKGFEEFELFGITDEGMEGIGIRSVAKVEEISAVGLFEVLPKIPKVFLVFRRVLEALKGCDTIVACDAPGFNLRLIREARRIGVKRVVYFISPQVWAWRPERAKVIAELCDHLIVILPFEVEIYRPLESESFKVHYLGHPLVDLVKPGMELEGFRERVGISGDFLNLMPGSRWGEVRRHVPLLREFLKRTRLRSVVPTFPPFRDFISRNLEGAKVITEEEVPLPAYTSMTYSKVSLIASGTASLEASLSGSPHAVFYKVNPITLWIGRRIVKTDFVSLPNIILGKKVVPELLNPSPGELERAVLELWESEKKRNAQREAFSEIKEKLGGSGVVERLRHLFEELLSF